MSCSSKECGSHFKDSAAYISGNGASNTTTSEHRADAAVQAVCYLNPSLASLQKTVLKIRTRRSTPGHRAPALL